MHQLPIEQTLLQIPQRWRHALGSLAKFDELLRDHLLGKACLQQPRLQVFEIPAVEGDLADVVLAEQAALLVRHPFVADAAAG